MEIVLALAAVVGISLIAVPRLRRRSRTRVRPNAGKQWTTTAAARRNRGPAAATTRNGWSTHRTAAAGGAGTASAVATEPYDEWDDDLDWGGETAVAASATAPSAPLPESDLDWQMPGENGNDAVTEPDAETEWDDWADAESRANGNGTPAADVAPPAPADDEVAPVNGNGVATPAADKPTRATPHGDARTDAPGTEDDSSLAEPDWDWEPTVSRAPAVAAATAAPAAPGRLGRARTARRKVNPLVLVALYALFGIGVIVIAVNVISGAMSGPDADRTPRTSATVEPTATPTPPAASGTANAEAQRLAQAFADQRVALLGQESRAAHDARAATRRARAARRKARAARRRASARRARRNASRPAASAPAATPVPVTPAPVTPAPSGGGGGGGGCEFCIG
jgi:hypothetical protein